MKALVTVMPKASVLDPQGRAVGDALRQLGLASAGGVRVGKFIEIELPDGDVDEAKLHALCRDFLSNPVVEDYRLALE